MFQPCGTSTSAVPYKSHIFLEDVSIYPFFCLISPLR